MKRSELQDYIFSYGLLYNVIPTAGIYAITIDDCIAYVGKSKTMYERCSQHIYNMENAIFNNEKKYYLLLAAKYGGHKVDCVTLAIGEEDGLTEAEAYYINKINPPLNIKIPGHPDNNIDDLKIEELIELLSWRVVNETETNQ